MKYFHHFVFIMVIVSHAGNSMGQSSGQVKTKSHGKKLTFKSYRVYSDNYKIGDSLAVEHFYKTGNDSVIIFKNGSYLTSFPVKNNRLVSPVYKQYYPDGTVQSIDSLNFLFGASKEYFTFFRGEHLELSKTFYKNGMLESVLYYYKNGADSIFKKWYESGVLMQMVSFGPEVVTGSVHYPEWEGLIVENRKFHSNGLLATKEIPPKKYISAYNQNGIIISETFDALIAGKNVRCKKYFYESGILRLISYSQENIPCGNWLEYSHEGILLDTIKMEAPHDAEVLTYAEMPPTPYFYVEQRADYPGPTDALKKYFDEKLSNNSFRRKNKLGGDYFLYFEITENGKAVFVDVKGIHAEKIKPDLKNIIGTMQVWRPGKKNGRPVSETFEAEFGVE